MSSGNFLGGGGALPVLLRGVQKYSPETEKKKVRRINNPRGDHHDVGDR